MEPIDGTVWYGINGWIENYKRSQLGIEMVEKPFGTHIESTSKVGPVRWIEFKNEQKSFPKPEKGGTD